MGLLPPNEFQEKIEKEVNLERDVAKKIGRDIEMLIFNPVRTSLEEIYKTQISPPAQPTKITPQPELKEKPSLTKRDIYREPIE